MGFLWFFYNLLRNEIVIAALLAYLSAQALKLILYKMFSWNKDIFEKENKKNWLMISGGMPSSHSAGMAALTVAIGFKENIFVSHRLDFSGLFVLALGCTLYFMNDAFNSRQAVGKNTNAINKILFSFREHQKFEVMELKELSGHTFPQVIIGTIWGAVVGFAVMSAIKYLPF